MRAQFRVAPLHRVGCLCLGGFIDLDALDRDEQDAGLSPLARGNHRECAYPIGAFVGDRREHFPN